jgi:hypothetical protein
VADSITALPGSVTLYVLSYPPPAGKSRVASALEAGASDTLMAGRNEVIIQIASKVTIIFLILPWNILIPQAINFKIYLNYHWYRIITKIWTYFTSSPS